MAPRNNRVTNSLVALSSAAVLSVYSAGYMRTKAAADRVAAETDERRPAVRAETPHALPVAAPKQLADATLDHPAAANRTASSTFAAPVDSIAKTTSDSATAKPATKAKSKTEDATSAEATTAAVPTATLDSVTTTPVAASMPVAAPEPSAPAPVPAPQWKDGTYTGWGTSRHGDIQAYVTIEGGQITRAGIQQCLTRYSCSWIQYLPGQVVMRQSPEVDYVSGATQSTNAFYYAIVDALTKAK